MKTLPKLLMSLFCVFALHITLYTLHSNAAVPHLINYQGRLTDASGKPLADGAHTITFRIFDAETAGNLLWQGTYSVTTQKGIFSVLLGDISDTGYNFASLAFDKPYFLEIKVEAEVMSPRQRIVSAAYAIRSETAENANQSQNANTVANIGASATPTANKLLPLDANAKLPVAALKSYDSGWFTVSANNSYTKFHNLGTTKVISMIYFSQNADGSGIVAGGFMHYVANYTNNSCMTGLTATNISIRTGNQVINQLDTNGNGYYWTSGYARIIMLALE